MNQPLRILFALLVLALTACATEIKVGTLNCYLLFDPAVEHAGKVDEENRMEPREYQAKLRNLASLVDGYDVVGLQETGGKAEVTALAHATGMDWAWAAGRDTATGQEVALLARLPGWKVTVNGRVADLDRVLSKHLLVTATREKSRVYFLVVHLIRPIGGQAEKHARQLSAVGEWMRKLKASQPGATVIVLGDTNNSDTKAGTSLFGAGREAGELNQFAATHLNGKCYDRLVVDGVGEWSKVEIRHPPYGKKPNHALRRVWTDHFLVGSTLKLP